MRIRKATARLLGMLYILLGGATLMGLLDSDLREQAVSLGVVLFRYSGFVVVGIGLLKLRKWSAYVLALLLGADIVFVFTIYGGQTMDLDGSMTLASWIGPVVIIALFFYIWPVLRPNSMSVEVALPSDGEA